MTKSSKRVQLEKDAIRSVMRHLYDEHQRLIHRRNETTCDIRALAGKQRITKLKIKKLNDLLYGMGYREGQTEIW